MLLPALAFAAPSQKLQAIYDSVDTLNVEELVALQDYVNAKIDASSAVNTDETTYVLNKNTKKFHYADCASAKSIKDKNRTTYTGSRVKSSPTAINRAKNVIPKLQADASEFNSVLLSQA